MDGYANNPVFLSAGCHQPRDSPSRLRTRNFPDCRIKLWPSGCADEHQGIVVRRILGSWDHCEVYLWCWLRTFRVSTYFHVTQYCNNYPQIKKESDYKFTISWQILKKVRSILQTKIFLLDGKEFEKQFLCDLGEMYYDQVYFITYTILLRNILYVMFNKRASKSFWSGFFFKESFLSLKKRENIY